MTRLVSRAESWETVYNAFANINFAAFDYNSVKQSILDYIKLYFPETFNDFIESSELIAIVEAFAYIAEILAYRIDVTAHENFITTAQRRDSILKLAKLISYKPSRPLPARGLVKITSVSTTETLFDATGTNLAGRQVRWNDSTNAAWKDQFILIMNRVMDQEFGSVVATDRFQMQDVLFEIYPLTVTQNVMSYTAGVYGQSINMELVPVAKQTGDAFSGAISGITERRPQDNAQFTILYGSDGLGDASDTTGFFCFTKQGILRRFTTSFDGITPNVTYNVPLDNINDTDVWVNNIDPQTRDIIVRSSNLPYRRETVAGKYGEWVEVDIAHAENVVFNTNPKRNKYEVETVGNNSVRILFGDGEFADIPAGTFDIWARTSLDDDIVIPQSAVADIPISFTYLDLYNQIQTFTFTITLIGSLQNASAAETTEHVRQTAPAVYYTQDRMVNGEDYNTYLRQNPTVLKLRAINRTFAGDSKYITWHDSSNTYEHVKMFGDDGILYLQDTDSTQTTPVVETNVLISSYVEPLLSSTDLFMQLTTAGVDEGLIRRVFNAAEKSRLEDALARESSLQSLRNVDVYFNKFDAQWYAVKSNAVVADELSFGGYQEIDFNGYATGGEVAITYRPGSTAPYTADIKIVGPGIDTVCVITTDTPPTTFQGLLTLINTRLPGGVTASLTGNGNIVVRVDANKTNPQASWVEVSEPEMGASGRLFSDIVISLDSQVAYKQKVEGYAYPTNFIPHPLIKIRQPSPLDDRYTVTRAARRIILESQTTAFWNTNQADRVMDYDTQRSASDEINILQANTNCNRTGILQRTWKYNVLGQENIESGTDIGMTDIHRVSIMAVDENKDGIPDNLNVEDDVTYLGLADIIKPKLRFANVQGSAEEVYKLPVQYIAGMGDITIEAETVNGGKMVAIAPPSFNMPTDAAGVSPVEFGEQLEHPYGTLGWREVNVIVDPSTGDRQIIPLKYGEVGSWIQIVNVMMPSGGMAPQAAIVDEPEQPSQNTTTGPVNLTVHVNEYVYFYRPSVGGAWTPVETSAENMLRYVDDYTSFSFTVDMLAKQTTKAGQEIQQKYLTERLWKRHMGRDGLNFAWMHYSPRYQLVDPSPTNIIDIFVITRGYFISFKRWLEDPLAPRPDPVTPLSLRNDYGKLLDNKMASDTVVLHPGKIKLLFGDKSAPALQARFKVIRSSNSTMTDNQIKNSIVATVRNFFDVAAFEFGETFYFTELAAAIHTDLPADISSVLLVPTLANSQFGDLLQVHAREDEILYPDIGVEDIDIVAGFTATNLRLNG